MSLPVDRDSIPSMLRDHLNRIRALEAKRRSSSTGGEFGESVELEFPSDTVATDPQVLEFSLIYDPHGFWSAGDPEEITIPAGLAGVYTISIPFTRGTE